MKVLEGYNELDVSGKPLPAGAYIVNILAVNDNAEKEYLELYIDIAEGEHKGHFKNINGTGFRCFRFYRANGMYYFKRFILSVEKSNPGYKWNWDEKTLIGKKASVVLQEQEYVDKDFNVKVRLGVFEWRSVQALKENRITLPTKQLLSDAQKEEAERERLAHASSPAPTVKVENNKPVISDDELPF